MKNNQTLKRIFLNLKPFLCYWLCCLTYLIFAFFEILSIDLSIILALIVYTISGLSVGLSIKNLKESMLGLGLYELMLIICPAIPWANDVLRNFSQLGNLFCAVVNPFYWTDILGITKYIFSVTAPLLIILLGYGISLLLKKYIFTKRQG